MQHEDFPGGLPFSYYSRPSTLNFGVLMGSGALVLGCSHPSVSLNLSPLCLSLPDPLLTRAPLYLTVVFTFPPLPHKPLLQSLPNTTTPIHQHRPKCVNTN